MAAGIRRHAAVIHRRDEFIDHFLPGHLAPVGQRVGVKRPEGRAERLRSADLELIHLGAQAGRHKNLLTSDNKCVCLQRDFSGKKDRMAEVTPLTEYLEYFRKR